jgi:hypothetical protein
MHKALEKFPQGKTTKKSISHDEVGKTNNSFESIYHDEVGKENPKNENQIGVNPIEYYESKDKAKRRKTMN